MAQCAGTGGSFCGSMFLLWVWHKLHAWNGAMAFPARPSLSDKAPTSTRRAKAICTALQCFALLQLQL